MIENFRTKYIAAMPRRPRVSIHTIVKLNPPSKTSHAYGNKYPIPFDCLIHVGMGKYGIDMKKLYAMYPHLKRPLPDFLIRWETIEI